ncbi:hypothetical protein H7F28_01510 [Brevibacterium sp. PAMC23299]|nr:hypothetical protein H7F28_01510 [Brevibacterium sp. PAMC23299]
MEINERSHFTNPQKKTAGKKYYLACKQLGFYLNKTKLIGAGVRDSCGESVAKGDHEGRPPAESEFPTFQSTISFTNHEKRDIQSINDRMSPNLLNFNCPQPCSCL